MVDHVIGRLPLRHAVSATLRYFEATPNNLFFGPNEAPR